LASASSAKRVASISAVMRAVSSARKTLKSSVGAVVLASRATAAVANRPKKRAGTAVVDGASAAGGRAEKGQFPAAK
jgi:hypothetical protein